MTIDRSNKDAAFFGEECGDLVHPDWNDLVQAMYGTGNLLNLEYILIPTSYKDRLVKLWPTEHWELS